MNVKIHHSADVQTNLIGENTVIWQNVVILKGAKIGADCNINCNCFIENDVKVGNNVTLKSGVYIWNGMIIEDDVFIGPSAAFTNDLFPRSKAHHKELDNITIKKGASIGANATIVAPIIIGEYSLIGAGSVVTKNIPPYTIWYGNPARHKGYVTKEGKKVNLNLKSEDGTEFKYTNEILSEVQVNNHLK
jgi:acetyltransferase-like isoleucine patch superfamily enzyme